MMLGLFDATDLTGIRWFPRYKWDCDTATPTGWRSTSFGMGVRSNHVPEVPAVLLNGNYGKTFADDFYERIHVSTFTLNIGTVVSSQVRELSVWNAWRGRTKIMTDLTLEDAAGIELSGQDDPPLVFLPLQERTYTVTVTANGPPTINAHVIYEFDDGTILDVGLIGRRAVAWTARPNWSNYVTERLEWLTDVIPSRYGKEQRRALRIGPRKSYEFSFVLSDRGRRMMENAMLGWGLRPFVLPQWPEGQPLFSAVSAGASVLPMQTFGRNIFVGSLIMLLKGPEKYEIAEVESYDEDSVTLSGPLQYDWPVGTKVYPAITAVLEGGVTLERATDTWSTGAVKLRSIEPVDLHNAGTWTPTMYLGLPVIDVRPQESNDPTTNYEREMVLVESQSGRDFIDDIADLSRITQSHRWMVGNIEAITELRSMFYYLQGKWKSAWLPTFRQDLFVVADIGLGSAYLEVEDSQLSEMAAGREGRRHIRIEMVNRVVYYREIESVARVDEETERVFFVDPIPLAYAAEQVLMVSFMMTARLQTDAVDFGFSTDSILETEVNFKSIVPYEVEV